MLLYIIRRTFGFKKHSDAISLTQMVEGITTKDGKVLDVGTGMSRRGVMKGCAGLLEKGVITVRKIRSPDGDFDVNVYSLRMREPESKVVGNVVPYGREPSAPPVGNEGAPQQTVEQETEQQQSVVAQLIRFGIGRGKAQELAAKYSHGYIEQQIKLLVWNQQVKKAGRPITDPAAWLIQAIEQGYSRPDGFLLQLQRAREATEARKRAEVLVTQQERRQQERQRQEDRRRAERLARLRTRYRTSQRERTRVLKAIKSSTANVTYQMWFAQTQLLSLKKGVAVLSVANYAVKDRLERRFGPIIRRAFAAHKAQVKTLKFEMLDGTGQRRPHPAV